MRRLGLMAALVAIVLAAFATATTAQAAPTRGCATLAPRACAPRLHLGPMRVTLPNGKRVRTWPIVQNATAKTFVRRLARYQRRHRPKAHPARAAWNGWYLDQSVGCYVGTVWNSNIMSFIYGRASTVANQDCDNSGNRGGAGDVEVFVDETRVSNWFETGGFTSQQCSFIDLVIGDSINNIGGYVYVFTDCVEGYKLYNAYAWGANPPAGAYIYWAASGGLDPGAVIQELTT